MTSPASPTAAERLALALKRVDAAEASSGLSFPLLSRKSAIPLRAFERARSS